MKIDKKKERKKTLCRLHFKYGTLLATLTATLIFFWDWSEFFFSSKSEIFSMRAKFNKKKATLWEKNNTSLKDCHTTISLICYKRFWQPAKQFQIEGYGDNASLTVVGNVDVMIFVISCDRKKSKAKKCNKFSHHIFSDATTSWFGLTRLSQMSPFW